MVLVPQIIIAFGIGTADGTAHSFVRRQLEIKMMENVCMQYVVLEVLQCLITEVFMSCA